MIPFRRAKKLGVSEGRRYDLPLGQGSSNAFLVLLIALMCFLAVLALSAGFALGQMTQRWSSGLENQMTIEIPAQGKNKNIRNKSDMNALKIKLQGLLKDYPGIQRFEIMKSEDIQDLVAPFLGEDFVLDDVPLPALIAVETVENTPVFLKKLRQDLQDVDPMIAIDTHEDWLESLLKLIGSMRFAALIVTMIVAVTGITAIAGAIRSRMAEHKPDIELLHLMGASDLYICKQFQRHALVLGLQGGAYGLFAGVVMLLIFGLVAPDGQNGLLPEFRFHGVHILSLLVLPFVACLLSAGAARFTVLRELSRMP